MDRVDARTESACEHVWAGGWSDTQVPTCVRCGKEQLGTSTISEGTNDGS